MCTVRYHVDWCTKNKRMVLIQMRGLFFNLHRELFFYFAHTTNHGRVRIYLKKERKERNTLTWKGSPVFVAVNSCPLRSLAWSQLSLHPLLFSQPCTHFPPKGNLFTYTWHAPYSYQAHVHLQNKTFTYYLDGNLYIHKSVQYYFRF